MSHIKTYARIKPSNNASHFYTKNDNTIRNSELINQNVRPSSSHIFEFSHVFTEESTQAEVFHVVAKQVITGFLNGYNGTVFAYGQTNSGKTYTVEGSARLYDQRGLASRTLSMIYESLESRSNEDINIYISCMEIYQEIGYDLLNPTLRTNSIVNTFPKVAVMEGSNGTCLVRNLSLHLAANEKVAQNLLISAQASRRVAETPMNHRSSRSHSVFTIQLVGKQQNSDVIVRSKLHLVDLAGSERVAKTSRESKHLADAKFINLSLHYLEGVIVALQRDTTATMAAAAIATKRQRPMTSGSQNIDRGWKRPVSAMSHAPVKRFIPYRNSLLTMLLKDSLGGNCQTAMIATLSMDNSNLSETLSTCRFSQRVACITNVVQRNEEIDDKSMIKILKKKICDLEMKLSLRESTENCGIVEDKNKSLSAEERNECLKLVQGYLQGRITDPISSGLSTIRRLKVGLQILKGIITDTQQKYQETPQIKIPEVFVDRTGNHCAVLQKPKRNRPWKYGSPTGEAVILVAAGKHNANGIVTDYVDIPTKSKCEATSRNAYKSPFERKTESLIRKLDTEVTSAKINLYDQQKHIVEAKERLKRQQFRLIEKELVNKIFQTKKQITDQRLVVHNLEHGLHDADKLQSEIIVDNQLKSRLVKMQKRLQTVRDEILTCQNVNVKPPNDLMTPAADRVREIREQTGRHISSKVVLDALRVESREQAKMQANIEKEHVAVLTEQIALKESQTRRKLQQFREQLKKSKESPIDEEIFGDQSHKGQDLNGKLNGGQGHNGQVNGGQGHNDQVNGGQGHNGQVHGGQGHNGHVNGGQGHNGQVNGGQGHNGQVHGGQGHNGHINGGQGHNGQVNGGKGHNGQVNGGKGHNGQVNGGKGHKGQIHGGLLHNQKSLESQLENTNIKASLDTNNVTNSLKSCNPIGYIDDPFKDNIGDTRFNGGEPRGVDRGRTYKDNSEVFTKCSVERNSYQEFSRNEPAKQKNIENHEILVNFTDDEKTKKHEFRANNRNVCEYREKGEDEMVMYNNTRNRIKTSKVCDRNGANNEINKQCKPIDQSEHLKTVSADVRAPSTPPVKSLPTVNETIEGTRAERDRKFNALLRNLLAGRTAPKKPAVVTFKHEEYDDYARKSRPTHRAAVSGKSRKTSHSAGTTGTNSSSTSHSTQQGRYIRTADAKSRRATKISSFITSRDMPVEEKVNAFLDALKINTSQSKDDLALNRPKSFADESMVASSGDWKRKTTLGKFRPNMDIDSYPLTRNKALVNDNERENVYLQTAKEQKQRVLLIRRAKVAAELIQRSWRKHKRNY